MMSVHFLLGDDRSLYATVSGDFNFQSSRELLLGVRKHWSAKGHDLVVHLSKVTHATSCSIGVMALLAEMAGRNFHVHLDQCDGDVESLFDPSLFGRYLRSETLQLCCECLTKLKPACELRFKRPSELAFAG